MILKETFVQKSNIIYGSIFLIVLIFGILRTSIIIPESKTVKVAGISGDIDIHKLMETEFETLELNSKANLFKVLEAEIISPTDPRWCPLRLCEILYKKLIIQ